MQMYAGDDEERKDGDDGDDGVGGNESYERELRAEKNVNIRFTMRLPSQLFETVCL